MSSGSGGANCTDFSDILKKLAELRKADDLIVVSLNNELPTRSFPDCKKSKQICEKFRTQLTAIYEERNNLIQRCIQEVSERTTADGQSVQPWRILLRQIKGEADVEQIIQDRSHKAIHERCDRI